MKTLLAILTLTSLVFGVDNDKKTDPSPWLKLINVRTSDTIVPGWDSTRAIEADVGGIVKFWQKVSIGSKVCTVIVVKALNDAQPYPIRGIIRILPLYNGTDSTTCQCYDTSGSTVVLKRAIRLWR